MIVRKAYIELIENFIDNSLIKIITGIRRCGKSSVLLLLQNRLLEKGVKLEQIIYINFESFNYSDLQTAQELYDYISKQIEPNCKNYLLLDEIQEVTDWQKCVNSLLVDYNTDIYLTGSNSHMLSSELATYLAGRYVEIPVFTLSFSEYLQFVSEYETIMDHDNMLLTI